MTRAVEPSRALHRASRAGDRLILGLALGVALAGCEPDGLRSIDGPPSRGFVLDAGSRAGSPDAAAPAPRDAGVPPPQDAGVPVDAGEAGGCECPTLPPVCTPPKLDAPIFTAAEDAQLELLNLLSCAETSVRAALYEMEWDCLADGLFDRLARAPNLEVELVIDDDQCPRDEGGKLTCALRNLEADPRVTVIDDARSRYMHHKFWVVDDRWVWTGSANMTRTSFCTDANDAVVLTDPTLVAGYAGRFASLYEDRSFGPMERTPPLTSGPYTLHFGPQSPLSAAPSWHEALLRAIGQAQTSIDFAVFALTREDVAAALTAAKVRGVRVRGVLHHRYASNGAAQSMLEAGVDLRKGSVHSKLLVVDTATVATGSPNWSSNAWMNNEDSLWIVDPGLAATYQSQVEQVWLQADPI